MLNLINNLERKDITKMLLGYKFALEEMNTKISILFEEYRVVHEYNPIEHVSTRIKSPKSIMRKIEHKGLAWSIHEIENNIRDIAGVRIICSFTLAKVSFFGPFFMNLVRISNVALDNFFFFLGSQLYNIKAI